MDSFSIESSSFLQDLTDNNNKEWFQDNKERYTNFVINPFKQLVISLSEFMLSIDPEFVVEPKVDRTISRINKDIRFSKDKAPYKTHMFMTIKRKNKDWNSKPAFFLEIGPVRYSYGMGMLMPNPNSMKSVREYIDSDPKAFDKLLSSYSYSDVFKIKGDSYAKKKSPHSEKINEFYLKKNIFFSKSRSNDDGLYRDDLYKCVIDDLKLVAPLYHQLNKMIEG
ncbi:MAG: DUF2461 domain-containing protein [Desulfobacterales bacterium]|nr:DUF2461 domain-containing protein [Desulfobacterales bacterium]